MARQKRYFQMPDIDQPDPEPNFQHSSDEFVIPASDEHGHSVRAQFRLPQQLFEWGSQIVNSRKFPFQRDADLMRYGYYLACVQLCRIDNKVPDFQGAIDRAAAVVRKRMYGVSLLKHVDQLAIEIDDLVKYEAWGEIIYMLAGEHRAADRATRKEPYWGQRWKDELHRRFDHTRAHAESRIGTSFVDLRPSHAEHEPPEEENED